MLMTLTAYRWFISPALHSLSGGGSGCRFSPSCSHYATQAFSQLPISVAIRLTLRRILRCHPWSKGGYDSVPSQQTYQAKQVPSVKLGDQFYE